VKRKGPSTRHIKYEVVKGSVRENDGTPNKDGQNFQRGERKKLIPSKKKEMTILKGLSKLTTGHERKGGRKKLRGGVRAGSRKG